MVGICPLLFVWWKFVRIDMYRLPIGARIIPIPYPKLGHYTHMRKPHEADITTGVAEIEEYTAAWRPKPPANSVERIADLTAAKLHLW